MQDLNELLVPALRGRAKVRVQLPLALSEYSEPEPDIAVVPLGAYRTEHPATAHLVIEVAGESARKDRGVKERLHAAAGIPEYWVVDVRARAVSRHRSPARNRYRKVSRFSRTDSLSPAAFPDVVLRVADFVP